MTSYLCPSFLNQLIIIIPYKSDPLEVFFFFTVAASWLLFPHYILCLCFFCTVPFLPTIVILTVSWDAKFMDGKMWFLAALNKKMYPNYRKRNSKSKHSTLCKDWSTCKLWQTTCENGKLPWRELYFPFPGHSEIYVRQHSIK